MNRKLITVLDIIIIALIVIFNGVLIFFSMFLNEGNKAVISVNEQIIGEYSLNTDFKKQIKTDYGFNTVIISNGKCSVIDADCRDGICVNRGKISKIGESIVCLPHKMIVEIK